MQFNNNQQPNGEFQLPSNDPNDDLLFNDPYFENCNAPLYIYPREDPTQFDVFSQPPSPPETPPPTNLIRFSSIGAMRRFIDSTPMILEHFVLILPATRYRSIRYDPRKPDSMAIILARNDSS